MPEWRSTRCRMNIIPWGTTYRLTHNPLWNNDGYAPLPAGDKARESGNGADTILRTTSGRTKVFAAFIRAE